jgi:hypothetical protein
MAFRLLTMDLLVLFHVMNEGTINVLGKIPQTLSTIFLTRQNTTSSCRNRTLSVP